MVVSLKQNTGVSKNSKRVQKGSALGTSAAADPEASLEATTT